MTASSQPNSIGDGRYQVLDTLGSGGTSVVYLCLDKLLGVERAVKLLTPEAAARPDLRHRLLTEARLLASFRHPNVVGVLDRGREGDRDFIVTELVRGESLAQRVRSSGVLEPNHAVQVIAGVLDGLAEAHARGVVHRDIKPHNILIDSDGTPRLIDFGIALSPDALRITMAGTAMGTVAYMAPEQRSDPSQVTAQSDLYSVGATLYWILTRLTPMDLAYADRNNQRWTAIPAALRPPLIRATRSEPEDRHPDAESLKLDLLAALERIDDPSRPPSRSVDDDLREVRSAYLRRLPDSARALTDAVRAGETERATRLIHQLRGSGGSYGFPRVSELAARAADAPESKRDASIGDLVDELHRISRQNLPPMILVIEDDPATRDMLAHESRRPNLDVGLADGAVKAMSLLKRHRPELIVIDLDLPDADGLELLATLRDQRPHVPMIVVTADPSAETAARARNAGVTAYLQKPLPPGRLSRAIDKALREDSETTTLHRIAVIEDDEAQALLIRRILEREGWTVEVYPTGTALRQTDKPPPSLYILDAGLPDVDGFELIDELTSDPATADVPVIFLTARTTTEDLVRGLDHGASDYIKKPFVPAELVARVRTLLRS